jgi:soluble lytic murein transglycosylase-like protein
VDAETLSERYFPTAASPEAAPGLSPDALSQRYFPAPALSPDALTQRYFPTADRPGTAAGLSPDALTQRYFPAPAPAPDATSPVAWQALIRQEALRQGVDPALALAVAHQESEFNPHAVGDHGHSLGFFQLQRGAAEDMGIDPARRGEPELNIPAGVGYLKKQLDANKGDVRKGLTRYNGGGDPHYYAHVMEHYPLYAPALSPDALSQRYFPAGK